MKNWNRKRQNGFTLLELIVVVAVLGLVTSLATSMVIEDSNQKRFELTKQRLADIKYAIVGNVRHAINGTPVLSGFYFDVGRLPESLTELLYQCRDASGVGLSLFDQASCEATAGNVWTVDWKGPYLNDVDTASGLRVYQDGWGNSGGVNFGWQFDNSTYAGSLVVQSLGLNQTSGGANTWENDYPGDSTILVHANETARIDYLKGLTSTYNLCVNTASKKIDLNYTDQTSCEAVADHIWATWP